MLVLNAADVRCALSMTEAIEVMKRAFAALGEGRAIVPVRAHLPIEPHEGVSLVMPAYLQDIEAEALAVKVVSLFDRNQQRGLARIQAAVLVLDPETGVPAALLEGATLTGIRTAAASGAATDLLARKESRVAAIFGAGVQARAHLETVCCVRPIEQAWIYGPTPSRVEALIEETSPQEWCRAELRKAESPRQAVTEADIICAATTSDVPVFDDADLKPGVHINAVGSYTPQAREVPAETVLRSYVVVDNREAAWEEAGDLIQPLEAGVISRDHVRADLGEVVLGRKPGRSGDEQVTFFKSVGVAVQDAAAARAVLDNAKALGLGVVLDW